MAKKKSFNLVKEDKVQKPQDMYAPPKCRCMRFIAIPAIIGFILLLILPNVDFNGDDWEETMSNATTASFNSTPATEDTGYSSTEETTNPMTKENQEALSYDKQLQTSTDRTTRMMPAVRYSSPYCSTSSNKCNITCTGDVYDVYKTLEDSYCSTGIHLVLENCEFQSGQMDLYFFTGAYKMSTLRIENCNLKKIAAGAFKRTSVTNIILLSILNSQLTELTAGTFEGLSKLEYFQVINSATSFSGSSFLVPFASTINTAVLQFKGSNNVYYPGNWITGANYAKLLQVNLMNNNFGQLLTQSTFVTLQAVQELLLRNCSISAIQSGTFEPLMNILQYLDLRQNYLQTLGEDLLYTLPVSGFRLELSDNDWSCKCENEPLLVTLKSTYITYTDEPLCSTPEEWSGVSLRLVTLSCHEQTPSSSFAMETTNATLKIISTTKKSKTTTENISTTPMITIPSTKLSTNSTTTNSSATTENMEIESTAPSLNVTTAEPSNSTESVSSETSESGETSESLETGPTEIEPSTQTYPTTEINSTNQTTEIYPPNSTTTTTETYPPTSTTTTNGTYPPTSTNTTTETYPPTETTPTNLIHIKCKKNGLTHPVSVRNYDVLFNIYIISCDSVKLHVLSDMDKLEYAYFMGNETFSENSRKRRSALTTTNIHIDDLKCKKSYVYCLFPTQTGNIKVSPFNCRGQYLEIYPKSVEAWLLYENVALFICMNVLGLILTMLLGAFGLYRLLRWRPTWLKGSERVKPIENEIHQVFLLPKHQEHDIECPYACCYHVDMDPSAFRDGSMPQCQCKHQQKNQQQSSHQQQQQQQQLRLPPKTSSNDYMVYYRGIDRLNERRFAEPAIGSNKPPIERAPSLPSDRSSTSVYSAPSISGSSQTTVCVDDLKPNYKSYKSLDYEYSSFELYEEIL